MLDLGQSIQRIQSTDRWTANALRLIEEAVNRLGKNIGADATGNTQAPPDVQGLNVKVAGELAHAVITDNSSVSKNVHYFLEYDTDPSFPQPHVEHLGTSRGRVITLPTKLDDGVTAQTYYFRAYSQYPGSKPSSKVNFGGQSATGVTMGGTTALTLIPSTGSGTASGNGQQGGYGFGKFQIRPVASPKRSVSA